MKKIKINTNSLKPAFSLMEMMVVLLIIAVIAAATAPMVSKKMMRSIGSGDNPWLFTDTNGSIAYNMTGNNNMRAIIGARTYTRKSGEPASPRLVLSSGNSADAPALVFATGTDGRYVGQFNMTENTVTMNGGSGNVGNYSVAMGMGQTHGGNEGTVAIGSKASATGNYSIAIGSGDKDKNGAWATKTSSIAIGGVGGGSSDRQDGALADATNSIAIGSNGTSATGVRSMAIGSGTSASGANSIAIGNQANASNLGSIAIGNQASASGSNSVMIGTGVNQFNNVIQLGSSSQSVYIPGNLVVMGSVLLGGNGESRVYVNVSDGGGSGSNGIARLGSQNNNVRSMASNTTELPGNITGDSTGIGNNTLNDGNNIRFYPFLTTASDARLKNIGKRYEAGLTELKKLDFYHYTFKKDKTKTPHVGVIAQDLQKVFPDAVTTDIYGYLRIRWDEMFYAVLNAVKELDTRITALSEQVKENFDKIEELETTAQEQQKTIDELKAQYDQFEKRIEKLEKVHSAKTTE